MAQVQTGTKVLVGPLDISCDLHTATINHASEMLDQTTFCNTTRSHLGGLFVSSVDAQGYVNLGSSLSDPMLFGAVSVPSSLVSVWPTGIQVGSTMQTGRGFLSVIANYDFGGSVGSVLPFTFKAESEGDMIRTVTLDNALSSAWSTTPNTSAAANLAHCSTGERLYAGLHVTALSTSLGASISGVIQAASSSGFASSNTRITFSAQTCKAGTFATPILASALSTDQPFLRSVITVSTGTSTGAAASGVVWVGVQ